ncbi:hypothetical protein OG874_13710 [Nocardia sp. NBC_00565]|uniref:hypothetical protein n=1 Tax=Nocardia sp. NBC_00565 TaxID=2975993 RepID=UPI002E821A7C|nr:hypothetical protein [Nocardia sp. NBC_00565]WUC06123.1 hypothetical protein OG874_13710 [Nocardia sp. NBC_00565]
MTSLLDGLVDDAGLFPPTALSMPDAVARHRADRRAASSILTHRFLCRASRIAELRTQLQPGDRICVSLIADNRQAGLTETLAQIEKDSALDLAVVEFSPVGMDVAVADVIAALPQGIPAFVEPAAYADIADLVPELARLGAGLKLRCGGLRPELFPSAAELADALATAARAGIPVKATAGLHHAVRYTDTHTGFTHHGFLNLVLASAAAAGGAAVAAIESTLLTDDALRLVRVATVLDGDAIASARALLTSYGSCSTTIPVAEAHAFGLIDTEGIR